MADKIPAYLPQKADACLIPVNYSENDVMGKLLKAGDCLKQVLLEAGSTVMSAHIHSCTSFCDFRCSSNRST